MKRMKTAQERTYVLRDVIHSDIPFNESFFRIINTKEFQRLNRIKQLSCEYVVFPTATHTRFAHSVGTYYVMKKLIERFRKELNRIGVSVSLEEENLALCSALLHDIGHGSLSHTFEHIFQCGSHEEWTVKILESEETEIHHIIIEEFSESFLKRLIQIISKKGIMEEENGIFSLISQLVSSQTDADRMDYLLRDSYFTSVTNGNYDLNRILRAFEIDEIEGKYHICVNEKYLSSIEEYILGRFYMHKEVYQHSLKRQMEGILRKIFQRAKELYEEETSLYCDGTIAKLLRGENPSLKEYIDMDDSTLMYHISRWEDTTDMILGELCKSFLNRKKFYKNKLRASMEDADFIKKSINLILRKRGKKEIGDFSKEYFYMEDTIEIGIYDRKHDNIWVKQKNGNLKDISEVSFILKGLDVDKKYGRHLEFLHFPLFQQKYGFDLREELEEISGEKVDYLF